jgi:recombination protein RecT
MAQELTVVQEVRQNLEKMQPDYRAVLPAHIPVPAFIRVAQTAIQMSPDLQECTPRSLLGACTKLAEIGLLPDGEQAAIVAYNVKVKTRDGERWEKQAKAMPMVAGIRDLVRRSGQVKDWKVRIVREGDYFKHVDGDVESLVHEPCYDDESPITHVYSIAYLENGELSRHVMTIGAVDKIRRRSRSADKGPWVTDYPEMVKKTCLRQHSKALPKAKDDIARERIQGAIHAVDDAEGVVDKGPLGSQVLLAPEPRMTPMEAAKARLAEAVEQSAFVDDDEDQAAPAAPAAPKPRKRKTANERLAEAEGRAPVGNGQSAPAAAQQRQAAPSSNTQVPAGQSASPAPVASSSPEDDGRDLDFESQARAAQEAEYEDIAGEPEGFRGEAPDVPLHERPEPAAFRDGWNTRFDGRPRQPNRKLCDTQKTASAWMSGYDAAQKTIDIGNAPSSPAASRIMCDNMISRTFPA